MMKDRSHRPAWRQAVQAGDADAVCFLDRSVDGGIGKRKRQDALFFQIRFVDPGEAPHNDGGGAQEPWRHGGVFAAAAFPVVLIPHCDPTKAARLIIASDLGERQVRLAGDHVPALSGFAGVGVDGAGEQVVTDVVEMAPEA